MTKKELQDKRDAHLARLFELQNGTWTDSSVREQQELEDKIGVFTDLIERMEEPKTLDEIWPECGVPI